MPRPSDMSAKARLRVVSNWDVRVASVAEEGGVRSRWFTSLSGRYDVWESKKGAMAGMSCAWHGLDAGFLALLVAEKKIERA